MSNEQIAAQIEKRYDDIISGNVTLLRHDGEDALDLGQGVIVKLGEAFKRGSNFWLSPSDKAVVLNEWTADFVQHFEIGRIALEAYRDELQAAGISPQYPQIGKEYKATFGGSYLSKEEALVEYAKAIGFSTIYVEKAQFPNYSFDAEEFADALPIEIENLTSRKQAATKKKLKSRLELARVVRHVPIEQIVLFLLTDAVRHLNRRLPLTDMVTPYGEEWRFGGTEERVQLGDMFSNRIGFGGEGNSLAQLAKIKHVPTEMHEGRKWSKNDFGKYVPYKETEEFVSECAESIKVQFMQNSGWQVDLRVGAFAVVWVKEGDVWAATLRNAQTGEELETYVSQIPAKDGHAQETVLKEETARVYLERAKDEVRTRLRGVMGLDTA